ncbi:hypothetical protein HK405_015748, partial [Cladochytrium tenue]
MDIDLYGDDTAGSGGPGDGDAFECRIEFKALLEALSASDRDIRRAAEFATDPDNAPFHHSLYECIKERMLDEATAGGRAKFLFVLDMIFYLSVRVEFRGYIEAARRDLEWLLKTALPEGDQSCAASLPSVMK